MKLLNGCLSAGFVAIWTVYSAWCLTHPEPFGELAGVANGLNLAALGAVLWGWAAFRRKQAVGRAYAQGFKVGLSQAAGVLDGRQRLALSLASKGHSIKVLGQVVQP